MKLLLDENLSDAASYSLEYIIETVLPSLLIQLESLRPPLPPDV